MTFISFYFRYTSLSCPPLMAFADADAGSPTKEEAMFTCGEDGEWVGTEDLNCTCE